MLAFQEAIFKIRLKSIHSDHLPQLIVDFHDIKSTLQKLPAVGLEDEKSAPIGPAFRVVVSTHITRVRRS